jgi:hypothetical protein
MGMAYLAHSDFVLGEPVLRRVRSQMVQTWGWDHTASIACLKALVDAFIFKDNYDAAENLYIDALDGIHRARYSEHTWTLELPNSVGLYYIGREDFENAIELLENRLRERNMSLAQITELTPRRKQISPFYRIFKEDQLSLRS